MGGAGQQKSGVISVRSPLSLAETIKNLLIAVERPGMIIDHARLRKKWASGWDQRNFSSSVSRSRSAFDRKSANMHPKAAPPSNARSIGDALGKGYYLRVLRQANMPAIGDLFENVQLSI